MSIYLIGGHVMRLQKQPFTERRKEPPEHSVWWKKLSLAQKFSAGSLGKFGYELLFIRNEEGRSIAVLSNNNGTVIITEDGEINGSPEITIR
ncbi:MAG: hypothetical protein ACI9N3_000715 [Colwellia sp.]|uniref:hypothetical protein n=1 Tax=Colwellia sp. Bg11-12 TaxID=2759817 RepID=UPI002870555B|nr:hypothetical protein [Colwellia sp. Bg11-12]